MNVINVKIDRNELRYLLNIIKYETDKAYFSFAYNKIEIIFFNSERGDIHKINLGYESYFNISSKEDKPMMIEINPSLLFQEINNEGKYYNKFISLSITPGDNFIKIESIN